MAAVDNEIEYFKIFRLEPFTENAAAAICGKKQHYFKISLLVGKSSFSYANKTKQVKKHALIFSNPQVPYEWEPEHGIHHGFSCIFAPSFFQNHAPLHNYSLFQAEGNGILELTERQLLLLSEIYQMMIAEMDSNYVHKYDFLRTTLAKVIHFAMKIQDAQSGKE